jgi:GT2 family glycosyltransferase
VSTSAITAVVVAFDSEETIDTCLTRLRAASDVAEIRVVDNASRDTTLEIVQRHAVADPRVRFIANPDNPGFAVACNQGAAASSAPWLAFVNPDCFVEADTLARLHDTADGLGGALVGAVLRGENGIADPAARRRDPDFAAMLRSRAARDLAVPRDPARPVQPVDAVSGALMVLPRALFDRVGGFDVGYRLHAEDLDLCRRVRQAGAAVAIDNTVEVLHVRGVSSRARPLFVEWHKHRGLWRYFRRFEAVRRGAFVRGAVFALIWGRFPFAVLRAAARRR